MTGRTFLGALAAISLGLGGGALLGGCGSQTKTVSAAGEPAAGTTAGSQPVTVTTHATTSTATGTATGGTPATSSARTAPEPAFTETASPSGGAASAAALVRARGYTPNDTSEYHAGQTLQVLVATRTGSGDGYDQRAFFFLNGRYLGTDAKDPSASVKVVSQGDTEVTIAYPLYRRSDPLCCPGGGQARVRFQLDNGRLVALDPIPPASSATGLSRN